VGYEVFDREKYSLTRGRGIKTPKVPCVTLNRGGAVFTFTPEAVKLMEYPEAVLLLYDQPEHRIAFRPVSLDDIRSYMFRKQNNERIWKVSASSFVKHFGIDVSKLRRYPAEMQDGMLVIDLHEELEVNEEVKR
jgi:hypothetical protein